MSSMRRRQSLGVLLLVATAACRQDTDDGESSAYTNVLPFDTAQIRVASSVDTARLTVELADTPEKHSLGLMERQSLPADGGMLFLYAADQPDTSAFWMFRTRIPLDIAFVDSAGVIRSIKAMQPCRSEMSQSCPDYQAGTPYRAALEVNAGYFARRNVRVGDRVFLEDTVTRRRAAPEQ